MSRNTNKIPVNAVKIGYSNWKIIGLTEKDASRRLIDGECHLKEQEIDYDTSMHIELQVNTLLHEIGHAIVNIVGIKFSDDEHEEIIINSLYSHITTFLSDNPNFYDLICRVFHSDSKPRRISLNSLKIAYGTWKLVSLSSKDAGRRVIDSECHLKEQEIDYDSSMNIEKQLSNIFIQVGKAISSSFMMQFKDSDQEDEIISSLMVSTLMVFRDNPVLFDWIGTVFFDDEEE